MPRTKRLVRKQKKPSEEDDTSKKLKMLVQQQKEKIDSIQKAAERNVELAFKVLLGSYSSTFLSKTIGELKNEYIKEVQTTKSASQKTSCTTSHDDGYLTENSSQSSAARGASKFLAPPPLLVTKRVRRSRSADASRIARPTPVNRPQRRRSRSVYRTPAFNKCAPTNFPPITPKMNPQTPLTLLRQPRQGEMVVSMSGSPVMVPSYNTMQPDEEANCNILLTDGTMLSLQPKQLRQTGAHIPFSLMNDRLLHQLKTLKDNLDTLVQLGEKSKSKQ